MVKFVAIWVQKGGTGKTTSAGNLAYALAGRGARVLMVDADPQGNLSAWLRPEGFEFELADVLKGKPLADAVVKVRPDLDLLGTFAIGGSLKNWAETVLPSKPFAFADLREAVERAGYSHLIVDLSPGASNLERALVAAADEVIPVVRPEVFSVDGLETFSETVAEVRRDLRANVEVKNLILNGMNKSFAVHKLYADVVGRTAYTIHQLGQSTRVPESQTRNMLLAELDAGHPGVAMFAGLAEVVA